jgi:hypothetical protein
MCLSKTGIDPVKDTVIFQIGGQGRNAGRAQSRFDSGRV